MSEVTLSYVGGPWAGATVNIPANLVVDRRDTDGGTYILDGSNYTWRADKQPVEDAAERPAKQVDVEETRPAAKQNVQERPAPPRRSRKSQAG